MELLFSVSLFAHVLALGHRESSEMPTSSPGKVQVVVDLALPSQGPTVFTNLLQGLNSSLFYPYNRILPACLLGIAKVTETPEPSITYAAEL